MPNVSLTHAMEHEIEAAIASGEYTSASEIVREGLRLWQQRRATQTLYDDWLAAEVALGWEQAARGELEEHDIESVIAEALESQTQGFG